MNPVPDSAAIWKVLATIPDPEFGVSIVDLGLIYSVDCVGDRVSVVMTLTTPSCPSGGWMFEGVKQAVSAVPGVREADVQVVFEPPWTPEMLSDQARETLGAR